MQLHVYRVMESEKYNKAFKPHPSLFKVRFLLININILGLINLSSLIDYISKAFAPIKSLLHPVKGRSGLEPVAGVKGWDVGTHSGDS